MTANPYGRVAVDADERARRRDLREVRRLVKELRLEAHDPAEARRYSAKRRETELVESFAERIGVGFGYARRLATERGVGVREPAVQRLPGLGWLATTSGAKLHLVVEWIIDPDMDGPLLRTACNREMAPEATETATIDGVCVDCRSREIGAVEWFAREVWRPLKERIA